MADMLSLHQPVCCIVLDQAVNAASGPKKTLNLSLRASLLHRSLSMQHLCAGFPILGCVASKEDHGYVVSAGISNVMCFLPYKAVPDSVGGPDIPIGKPIDCIIEKINEGARSLTLRAHSKAVAEATVKAGNISFLALRAGMLLNIVVEKVIQNGLVVNFLGLFHGVIDSSSLFQPVASPTDLPQLAKGSVHLARIVFINYSTKSVRLSLRPHVVDMKPPKHLPERGSMVSSLSVISTDKKVGILLSDSPASDQNDSPSLDEEEPFESLSKKEKAAHMEKLKSKFESVLGVLVHRSSLAAVPEVRADGSTVDPGRDVVISSDKIDKVYSRLRDVQVRVIGYHMVEGVVVASNLHSYMHSEVVHSSQLYAGQVVDTEVSAIRDFGLVVLVGGKVRAVCPAMHLSEVGIPGGASPATLKAISKKFKAGQKLKMRVWECSGNGFVLTNKKSLVEDNSSPIIADYDSAVEGMVSKGVISKISAEGLRVHFYNRVVGSVPMSVLVQQGVHDVEAAYRVGQTVSCIILGKSKPKEYKGKGPAKAKPRLTLGLDIGDASATISSLKDSLNVLSTDKSDGQEIGSEGSAYEIVSGTIIRDDGEALSLQISGEKRTGTLLKSHISDTAEAGVTIAGSDKFVVGSKIAELLVLSSTTQKNGRKNLQVTMKPLLLKVARGYNASAGGTRKKISEQLAASNDNSSGGSDISIPCQASDLSPGQIVAGVIWKVESYGVLIKFRDNLTALVPRTNLADRFLSTPVGSFEVGDAVRCAIQRVDYARERVIATFKSAFVPQSSAQQAYVLSKLEEEFVVAHITEIAGKSENAEASIPDWRSALIGTVVSALVVSARSYGLVLELSKGKGKNTMMLARGVEESDAYSRGQKLQCAILDIDLKNKVLDVTIDKDIVEKVLTGNNGASKDKKSKSKKYKSNFSALSVGDSTKATVVLLKESYIVVLTVSGVIGYAQVRDYHCPKRSPSEYSLGQEVMVRVEQLNCLDTTETDLDDLFSPYSLCAIFTLQSSFDAANLGATVLASRVQYEAEQADEELHSKLSLTNVVDEKQKFLNSLRLGAIMHWQIVQVGSLELQVVPEKYEEMGLEIKASVHISGNGLDEITSDRLVSDVESVYSESMVNRRVHKKGGKSDVSQEQIDAAIAKKHPFNTYNLGDKITCRIAQLRREDNKTASEPSGQRILIYLSLVNDNLGPGEVSRRMVQWKGKDGVKAGNVYPAVVASVEATGVVVALSPYVSTRLSYMDISQNMEFLEKVKRFAGVGMSMLVYVSEVTVDENFKTAIVANRIVVEQYISEGGDISAHLHGAMNLKPLLPPAVSSLKAGQIVEGVLNIHPKKIRNYPAFAVYLPFNRVVRVCITEFADQDDWMDLQDVFSDKKADTNSHRNGSVVSVRILSVNQESENSLVIEGSLRLSRLSAKKKSVALSKRGIPSTGELVSGYVAQTTGKGCFVRLSNDITGQILVKNLSDDFIDNPSRAFRRGKLIKNAVVLEVSGATDEGDLSNVHVHLSLKSSDTGQVPEAEAADLEKLHKGMVSTGKVQSIAACGVFVAIDGTSLVGLSRPPLPFLVEQMLMSLNLKAALR